MIVTACVVLISGACGGQPDSIVDGAVGRESVSSGSDTGEAPDSELAAGPTTLDAEPVESASRGEIELDVPEIEHTVQTDQTRAADASASSPEELGTGVEPRESASRWEEHTLAATVLEVDDLQSLGDWVWGSRNVDLDDGRPSDADNTVCGLPVGDEPPAISNRVDAPALDSGDRVGLEFEQIVAYGDGAGTWMELFRTLTTCEVPEPRYAIQSIDEIAGDVRGSDDSFPVTGVIGDEDSFQFTAAFGRYNDVVIGVYLAHSEDISFDAQTLADLVALSWGRR